MRRKDTVPETPTLVSLFTGAGGLDIGLETAGFDTVVANDSDSDAVATLRANQAARIPIPGRGDRCFLEHAAIIHSLVENLVPSDLRPRGASARWSPDLMAGGPPCQPFSSSGKMLSVSDPRGRLFEDFVRLAEGLRPRVILFENVRGLVTARGPSGAPGEALYLVKEKFESIGYATRFALLNAADFGAPQRRVRLFMIGCRSGELPTFPMTTHDEVPGETLFGGLAPWITLAQFLREQPPPAPGDIARPSEQLARQLETVAPGSGLKSAGSREATRPGGHWGYRQGTFLADPDKPARTVTASTSQDWVRDSDGRLRRLTWRECAALQGFPPEWTFAGNTASRYRQIGNAVPAVFGAVIGERIAAALRSRSRGRSDSAPLPSSFTEAMSYTLREHARNGASRQRVAQLIAAGADPRDLKGLGSAERHQPAYATSRSNASESTSSARAGLKSM